MTQFPAVVRLDQLDGLNGFRIVGEDSDDDFGAAVSGAGDINGDGYDDVIVGAGHADPHGLNSGAAYVIFGGAPGAAVVQASALGGVDGFEIHYDKSGVGLGGTVSDVGDLNGDGMDDFAIGTSGFDRSFVIYGRTRPFPAIGELRPLSATAGFTLRGVGQGDAGGVSSAGDVNGDGLNDMLIDRRGTAHVVFGRADGFAGEVDLTALTADDGFTFGGATSVAAAGDINGDGFDDLIAGTSGRPASYDYYGNYVSALPGRGYVIFGRADGFGTSISLAGLDGEDGFKIETNETGSDTDFLGRSVAAAGDVNGDGFADIILGSGLGEETTRTAAIVVFGKATGFDASLNPLELNGSDGFRMDFGTGPESPLAPVASAGDMNGDGYDDLVFVAPDNSANPDVMGAVYVVFGKGTAFTPRVNLYGLGGGNGFKIESEVDQLWIDATVDAAGDLNGDGLDDIVIGNARPEGGGARSSFVVYGRLPDAAVNRTGTDVDQNLVGGNFDDRLSGQGGADRLYGNDGLDQLLGGAGVDFLIGGRGADVLSGGAKKDIFAYFGVNASNVAAPDTIIDLARKDVIDLSGIDANTNKVGDQGFRLVDAFTGSARELVLTFHASGTYAGKTSIEGDVNGDGQADLLILATGAFEDFAHFVW